MHVHADEDAIEGLRRKIDERGWRSVVRRHSPENYEIKFFCAKVEEAKELIDGFLDEVVWHDPIEV